MTSSGENKCDVTQVGGDVSEWEGNDIVNDVMVGANGV